MTFVHQGTLRLKKRYGQHVIVSPGIIKTIVKHADVREGETFVEIGPGTGNLTVELLNTSLKKLHLIELDQEMIQVLKKKIVDERVEFHHADATSFDFCKLGDNVKLVGNLPYNVASLIIENTVFHKECIPFALYMVQKEVAEKLIKGMSWLSIFLRTFYSIEYIMSVPARFFKPPPRVQSSLIKLTKDEKANIESLGGYKAFLVKLYSMKRKAIKSKISQDVLKRAGINPMVRVEELSLDKVLFLYGCL
ncbi:MAG: 16S rRNA (adenine(1518)-N(6)/adenine(1519)-N(6))-dimethyltransferase RsmA [Aquificaceae bacterium]